MCSSDLLRGVARRLFGAGVLGRDVIQIPWAEVVAVEDGRVIVARRG